MGLAADRGEIVMVLANMALAVLVGGDGSERPGEDHPMAYRPVVPVEFLTDEQAVIWIFHS
ncbi:hypothetical protein [Streptomyces sp. NPDC091217]|uniref:hypothetical protein n=1 Tax=Streptomyces sp. NPDC091217 TaxID=3365975 RepID=UPI003807CD28